MRRDPVTVYRYGDKGTLPLWCEAFARGAVCKIVTDTRVKRKGAVAMFGSPGLRHVLTEAHRLGRTIYYGDHAYFERFRFFRVTRIRKGAHLWPMQYAGDGAPPDHDRFRDLRVRLYPWRKSGRYVLVCPPDRAWCDYEGIDPDAWMDRTWRALRAATDREIVIRERSATKPLKAALRHAWALVGHHTNAAVEAVCYGVPVFVTAPCAALPMAETDLSKIETPRYPADREDWAAALAANQWTLDEMREGKCWREIGA